MAGRHLTAGKHKPAAWTAAPIPQTDRLCSVQYCFLLVMVGIGSKRRDITPYAATDDFHAAFPETSGEQLQGPEIPVRDLCGGGVAARDPQAFFIEIDRFMPHPGWEKQNIAG